jgi:hypothetical protein
MKVEERKVDRYKTKMVRINNITMGIATEIGPRILYLASSKKPKFNLFGVHPEMGVQTPEGFWRFYGGHRLWSSPEAKPRSYSMDDKPVKIEIDEESIRIYREPELENSIQKAVTIRDFSENSIQVVHAIKNIGRWPIKIGCWALSMMRQNGFAIIPLKPSKTDQEGLLPDRQLSLWPYTDMLDERLLFKKDYLFVKQNPEMKNPLKIGTMANPTWAAYWVEGMVFVKHFPGEKGEYPDFGCNVEVYTDTNMLELETVGPLKTVNPFEHIEHTEIWEIHEVGELMPEPDNVKNKLEVQFTK